MYSQIRYKSTETETYRERSLFLLDKMCREYMALVAKNDKRWNPDRIIPMILYYRDIETCLEDAFFRGQEQIPVRSPAGERAALSAVELREIYEKIHERLGNRRSSAIINE